MEDVKRILVFDILGYMAHFRKYYSNSSSLTHSFPPCTTIAGLIAGISGKPRDSYYEEFSRERCRIGVGLNTETRKIVQTMNYIRTKSRSELDGSAGPTPTPLEILLSKESKLSFRIYFSHLDNDLVEDVKRRIVNHKYVYPPYLGITEFTGQVSFVADVSSDKIRKIKSDEIVEISTAINTDFIKDKGIAFDGGSQLRVFLEKMPLEFDKDRNLKEVGNFIFEAKGRSIPVKLNVNYYEIEVDGQRKNILFLNQ